MNFGAVPLYLVVLGLLTSRLYTCLSIGVSGAFAVLGMVKMFGRNAPILCGVGFCQLGFGIWLCWMPIELNLRV